MVGGIRTARPCHPRGAGLLSVTQSEGARAVAGGEPKMLESVLALGGLVLLRDCVEREGRSLLKALIKKSALCGEQVHILGCEVSEEEFREGFDSDVNSRLIYHDFFRDPLSWSKTGEALPGGPLGVLRTMGSRTDGHPPEDQMRVLGLVHEELHGPGPMGALSSLAQTEVTLGGVLGQTSAHILCRRPQQRPSHQTQWFSILPDFSLDLQGGPPLESQPHPVPHTSSVDPTAHLTFNLRLSKKEREAKDSLTLPFQFSSEKQQVLLRSGPSQASSHIFYEPDAYDDLDQEDPDDDLDI
ncbi:elongator complex protein 5 isoform X2 [Dasypus novemcinctus]|uniref:elongator complex protein 5 isoform X2 n=1 Tax=Dasypus novemcinctus TaxID=9361 RepID=UPI00265FC34F|nr:elongator complex protein 5 isoform X2 [Dasypus novemcinctus]